MIELRTEEARSNAVHVWRLYWFHESDPDASYPADVKTLEEAGYVPSSRALAAETELAKAKEAYQMLRNDSGNLLAAMRFQGSQPAPTVMKAFRDVERLLAASGTAGKDSDDDDDDEERDPVNGQLVSARAGGLPDGGGSERVTWGEPTNPPSAYPASTSPALPIDKGDDAWVPKVGDLVRVKATGGGHNGWKESTSTVHEVDADGLITLDSPQWGTALAWVACELEPAPQPSANAVEADKPAPSEVERLRHDLIEALRNAASACRGDTVACLVADQLERAR